MRHLLLAVVAAATLAACATPQTTAPVTPPRAAAPAAPAAAAPAAAPAAAAPAAAAAAPAAPPQCWNAATNSFSPVGARTTFEGVNLECRAIQSGRSALWVNTAAAAAPAAPAR